MWFAIIARDQPDSLALRTEWRTAHRRRIEALKAAGRLLTAGPFPAVASSEPGPAGFGGSLIVAEFADAAAAQQWAETDPYQLHGVYAHVEVKPYLQVF